ncbi:MAG: hypothetical protein MI923_16660 [Phycisphaerales bacterium]|nr:hypothetical protein [Phycisphaerales bacterium]
MTETPKPIQLPVDRTRSMTRGLWRLAASVLVTGSLWQANPDWGLLWQTHRATFLALATLYLIMIATSLLLLAAATRWLLLACWMAELGVEISPESVRMKLGPFGRKTYDWSGIQMKIEADFDWELIDHMLGDTVVPSMRHPDCGEDLLLRIQRFAGLETEELMALLRPYVKRALSDMAG